MIISMPFLTALKKIPIPSMSIYCHIQNTFKMLSTLKISDSVLWEIATPNGDTWTIPRPSRPLQATWQACERASGNDMSWNLPAGVCSALVKLLAVSGLWEMMEIFQVL